MGDTLLLPMTAGYDRAAGKVGPSRLKKGLGRATLQMIDLGEKSSGFISDL